MTANYTQLGMVSNYLLPDFYQKIRLTGGGVMGDHQLSSLEKAERDKPIFLEEGNLLFHSTDSVPPSHSKRTFEPEGDDRECGLTHACLSPPR